MGKHFLKSKTIWGAIISSLVLISMYVSNPKTPDMEYFVLTGLLSNIGVIWGRFTAKDKVYVRKKNGNTI